MSNRQRALIGLASIALLALAFHDPLFARDWTARDIAGSWGFTTSEIRLTDHVIPNADVQYCDAWGDITFLPDGEAELEVYGRRCVTHDAVAGTAVVEFESALAPAHFDYEVVGETGEIQLWELDEFGDRTVYVTHGRILQRGTLLLFDGTGPELGLPTHLLTHAVGVRK